MHHGPTSFGSQRGRAQHDNGIVSGHPLYVNNGTNIGEVFK